MSLFFEKLAVLSKNSWVLINCGKDAWSKRTKIIPENNNLECKIPKISEKVYPNERVRIWIIFKLNESDINGLVSKENKNIEIKFNIFHPKHKNFGEPLRVYLEVDEQKYNQINPPFLDYSNITHDFHQAQTQVWM